MSAQDDAVAALQHFVAVALAADAKRIDDQVAGIEASFFRLPQDDIGARAWVAPKANTLRAALRDLATQLKAARVESVKVAALIRAKEVLSGSAK